MTIRSGALVTSYSVDVETGSLVRTWRTRGDCLAAVVLQFPAESTHDQRRATAVSLTRLAEGLWQAYARSGMPVSGRLVRGRRARLKELLGKVVGVVRPSMAGMPRNLTPDYEQVVDRAQAVQHSWKAFDDAEVQEAIIREMEAEVDAIDRADRGVLTHRAAQATMISRAFVVSSQVTAVDDLLRKCLLDDPSGVSLPEFRTSGLLNGFDPTAAAVAGLQWFNAAVDVVADSADIDAEEAVWRAHDQRETRVAVLREGVLSIKDGRSAGDTVVALVSDALAVSDGLVMNVRDIQSRVDVAARGYFGNANPDDLKVPMLLLQTQDPAWELLQACLEGIGACRDAFAWISHKAGSPDALTSPDRPDDDEDECEKVTDRFIALLKERLERNHSKMLGTHSV